MGETAASRCPCSSNAAFSILKRIVMGETILGIGVDLDGLRRFQYPQADRDG